MTVKLTTGATLYDLDAVTLENDHLRLTILPRLGGRIWSLIHNPTNRELLWHNPNATLAPVPFAAPYDAGFDGGWDEVFPNDAAVELDSVSYPDHGEVWSVPAALEVIDSTDQRVTIRLSSVGRVTGARFDRWLTLRDGESIVRLRYVIQNPAESELKFLWKPHPPLALHGPARLDLPARRVIVDTEISTGIGTSEAQWPFAGDGNGNSQLDLRQIPSGDSGRVLFFNAVELDAGWCAVTHTVERIGFALAFDPKVLPYVCVFGAFETAHGMNTIIPEPCTAYPYRLDQAIAQNTACHLAPGATLDTTILAVVYTGLDHVTHVTPDGVIQS